MHCNISNVLLFYLVFFSSFARARACCFLTLIPSVCANIFYFPSRAVDGGGGGAKKTCHFYIPRTRFITSNEFSSAVSHKSMCILSPLLLLQLFASMQIFRCVCVWMQHFTRLRDCWFFRLVCTQLNSYIITSSNQSIWLKPEEKHFFVHSSSFCSLHEKQSGMMKFV